ncbi:hypothetical protein LTR84_009835 [Exophiala bonariae]|uniref:Box C/D snoRNA protein 1 n=1 Tax=Exophiala bonariae TaxID=1690606 RepID=A0AAV9NL03_9EURO|nr:hypothetical protein LTR84_009835 [Exophiala bonariae]
MQETGGDTPLTDLCAICHANPIKYTCPRCGIHTCSLPCVKRHKTWAQCSGIRNPAAYRPRTELATPSSIDQDFNFISSVERSLSRADDLILDKGIDLAPSGLKTRPNDAKSNFETEVERRRIYIIKAPLGLSRSKQNTSHWARQHKCITWTTEWVHPDGEKRLQNFAGSMSLAEAFLNRWGRKSITLKKRKRNSSETAPAPNISSDTPAKPSDLTGEPQPISPKAAKIEASHPDDAGETQIAHPQDGPSNASPDKVEPTRAPALDAAKLVEDLHFYLLRPNTLSGIKCLIPLSSLSAIHDVLEDRTILEFPTFYVKEESPEQLSEPYMTEEKYNEAYGSDIPLELQTFAPKDSSAPEEAKPLTAIDESKVLEVLQKDLMG